MKKKINENLEVESPLELAGQTAKNLAVFTAKPLTKAVKAGWDSRHYKHIAISDIISYALNKRYIKQRDCGSIESDVIRYQCQIHKLLAKIKEMEKASKYCKYNSDQSLCELRLAQQVKKYQTSILEYQESIAKLKRSDLEAEDARNYDPHTYYDNEYEVKEFE